MDTILSKLPKCPPVKLKRSAGHPDPVTRPRLLGAGPTKGDKEAGREGRVAFRDSYICRPKTVIMQGTDGPKWPSGQADGTHTHNTT